MARSDTSGDPMVAVDAISRLREAQLDPDGTTLQLLAESVSRDEEEAMEALVKAACEGWIETDLQLWKPASARTNEAAARGRA